MVGIIRMLAFRDRDYSDREDGQNSREVEEEILHRKTSCIFRSLSVSKKSVLLSGIDTFLCQQIMKQRSSRSGWAAASGYLRRADLTLVSTSYLSGRKNVYRYAHFFFFWLTSSYVEDSNKMTASCKFCVLQGGSWVRMVVQALTCS